MSTRAQWERVLGGGSALAFILGMFAMSSENWWLLGAFVVVVYVVFYSLVQLVKIDSARPHPQIQQYQLDPLPPDNPEFGAWRLTVDRMQGQLWAVHWGPRILRNDGREESSWDLRAWDSGIHGFRLQSALTRAQKLMWRLRVNGQTAAQFIREHYPDLERRIPDGF